MIEEPEWTRDPFLEHCLERPVYRLREPAAASRAIVAARTSREWMIEARVSVEQVATLAALTALGFLIIDTNIQLDCRRDSLAGTSPRAGTWSVRASRPADRHAVERIAAHQLTASRFHLDPRIGGHLAARVKREWVGNFFEGRRGERLLVVDTDAGVRGFLLVLEREALGVIDLVALEPDVRGSGAAAALVESWRTGSPQLERFLVGTQISNVRSLRAYAKLGFRVCAAAHVLHKHAGDA
jgi:GNAT superfamily N-acetyltransferase